MQLKHLKQQSRAAGNRQVIEMGTSFPYLWRYPDFHTPKTEFIADHLCVRVIYQGSKFPLWGMDFSLTNLIGGIFTL